MMSEKQPVDNYHTSDPPKYENTDNEKKVIKNKLKDLPL